MFKTLILVLFLSFSVAAQLTTISKDDTMELQLDKSSIIRSKTTVLFTAKLIKDSDTLFTIFMVECARGRYVMLGHYGRIGGEELMFPDGKIHDTSEATDRSKLLFNAVCKPEIKEVLKVLGKDLEAGDDGPAGPVARRSGS